MKIAQLRRVLETVADIHESGNRRDQAELLRKLSAALKMADKEQVTKTVEKLSA
jgi:hypothetical protein